MIKTIDSTFGPTTSVGAKTDMFRSVDGGVTWTVIPFNVGGSRVGSGLHLLSSNRIVLFGGNSLNHAVYASDNQGVTFYQLGSNSILNKLYISSVMIGINIFLLTGTDAFMGRSPATIRYVYLHVLSCESSFQHSLYKMVFFRSIYIYTYIYH